MKTRLKETDTSNSHFPDAPWWREPLDHRTAADLIQRSPTVVSVSARAQEAEQWASELGIHHLIVVSSAGEPVGVLCLCDLWSARPATVVWECMSTSLEAVDASTPLEDVAEVIRERHFGCLPVLDEGRVVGVLTRGDLRRAGLLSENECPRCTACRTYHHVREDPGSGELLCVKCRDGGRSWEFDDRDEDYEGGD